jgi:hypothetical protein
VISVAKTKWKVKQQFSYTEQAKWLPLSASPFPNGLAFRVLRGSNQFFAPQNGLKATLSNKTLRNLKHRSRFV